MFDLTRHDKSYEMSRKENIDRMDDEEFDREAERILNSLTLRSNCITKEDYARHTQEIMDFYEVNMKYADGPPEVMDVVMDVMNSNDEKAYELGAMDLHYGKDKAGFYNYIEFEEGKEESEYICELADLWSSDYQLSESDDLPAYVMEILDEQKVCYQHPSSQIVEDRTNKQEMVYFNDCQNILLSDWQWEMITSLHPSKEFQLKEIPRMMSVTIVSKG